MKHIFCAVFVILQCVDRIWHSKATAKKLKKQIYSGAKTSFSRELSFFGFTFSQIQKFTNFDAFERLRIQTLLKSISCSILLQML